MNSYIATKKELYISVCAAVFAVVVFTFSIVIVAQSISSLNKESLQSEIATTGIEETLLIKKDLADWRDEINLIENFFVNPGGEIGFIEKLEAVAKNSGVKIEISSISVGKKETSSDFIENLGMKVRFDGEWRAVAKFLKSVEAMPYAVSISNVEANLLDGLLWRGEADVSVLKTKG